MSERWVKLYPKVLRSRVFKNAELLRTWIWCLCKATWRETWATVSTGRGDTEVKLEPGQFLYGREAAAKELQVKPSTIRNRMKKLADLQNLDIQKDRHYSIVTIRNWGLYQCSLENEDRQEDRQRTTKGQPKDTFKNKKNTKKKESSKEDSSVALKVSAIVDHYGTHHPRARPGDKERAKIRARLKEGYTVDELCRAIDGCHRSPHHCGENDRGAKYQSLELIVRDSGHVQQFLEVPEEAGRPAACRVPTDEELKNWTP